MISAAGGALRGLAGSAARTTYPRSGTTANRYSIVDRVSGKTYGISLSDSGQELNSSELSELLEVERAAMGPISGPLTPRLQAWLETASAETKVKVRIRVKEPDFIPAERPAVDSGLSKAEIDAWQQAALAARAAQVQTVVAPVVARLAALSATATTFSLVPTLSVELTAAEIAEVATWQEIQRIDLVSTGASGA